MRLTPHRLKPCAPSELRAGDHIAVRRPGIYVHHGIYLGQGSVVHFSDEGGLAAKGHARVIESPLEVFLCGGRLLRRRHWRSYPREVVLERAYAVMRGEIDWRSYHLFRNNCEHFATFCAAPSVRSVQVQQVAGAAAIVSALLATAAFKRRLPPGA